MVHEAMVLEYSGRHLALIELAAVAQAPALYLADRLRLPALGHRAGRRRLGGLCRRRSPPISPSSRSAALLLALFETVDRQDARLPRARFPRRRADARPARHASALRLAEPSDGRLSPSTSPICSPAAWCWSASCCSTRTACTRCSTSSRCTPSCWRCRSPGRPMSRTRRISTSPRRSRSSSRRSSSRSRCTASSCASASTARSRRSSASARPCSPAWRSSRCRWW